ACHLVWLPTSRSSTPVPSAAPHCAACVTSPPAPTAWSPTRTASAQSSSTASSSAQKDATPSTSTGRCPAAYCVAAAPAAELLFSPLRSSAHSAVKNSPSRGGRTPACNRTSAIGAPAVIASGITPAHTALAYT